MATGLGSVGAQPDKDAHGAGPVDAATLRVAVASDSVPAVSGNVASGATDSGNPVKVGGKYNATQPTLTDGQRGDVQLDSRGNLKVLLRSVDGVASPAIAAAGTDAIVGGSTNGLAVLGLGHMFSGVGWDRIRNNAAATGLASAARTASTPTPDQTNYNGRGAQITLDVTATPNNAETLQVTVEVKDPVSGKYVQVAAFTALTASVLGATPTTETYVYTLYPGAAETVAAAKHELQALPLGRTWRVNVLHSAGGSWTYSVGVTNLN